MKSIRKIIIALSLGILCTGCSNNNKTVKITINSGVGSFGDQSTTTTLLVSSGTKLSECRFVAPCISIYRIEDLESEEEIPVLNYRMENNKIYEDTPITNDTILYANYYESLDKEKEIGINTITEAYEKISNKTDIVVAKYYEGVNAIINATTSYELFFLVNHYEEYLSVISLIDDADGLYLFINLDDTILSNAEKVKDDQRIMSYIEPLRGLFQMSPLRHEPMDLFCAEQTFNIISEYVEQINPNISYVYGTPFSMFIRARSNQSQLIAALPAFYTYARACTFCDTTPKVLGLSDPLVAIAAISVLKPEYIRLYVSIYQEFVEYTLNS